jgi:hypothetical protein
MQDLPIYDLIGQTSAFDWNKICDNLPLYELDDVPY